MPRLTVSDCQVRCRRRSVDHDGPGHRRIAGGAHLPGAVVGSAVVTIARRRRAMGHDGPGRRTEAGGAHLPGAVAERAVVVVVVFQSGRGAQEHRRRRIFVTEHSALLLFCCESAMGENPPTPAQYTTGDHGMSTPVFIYKKCHPLGWQIRCWVGLEQPSTFTTIYHRRPWYVNPYIYI